MGRRRAAVLIGIHVLIVIHIIHWLATGRTVSPVEPSESMETIETGLINAGAIFFLLAILSTLIFGRFFCGWGCHVVALQDLCGWLMKKCGIRPVPFRSRLLPLIPVILAVYMFAWPTILKGVIEPTLDRAWPEARAVLGPMPGVPTEFADDLVQEDFWSTFPTIAVAIPFLLVCGFATVYFLGAKGFCTYGCPYGGVFAPADKIAPGRIVVDHDKCEGCGHCTAVCTSNVRVHEEIREYGMVVSPGCMKCMDCVSVCPNDALSFKFTRPSIARGKPRNSAPKPKFDTTIANDLALGAVFFVTFSIARGTYPVIPMLFAVGIAGCMTFIAWKAWCTLSRPNVRIAPFQLRLRGRIKPAGLLFLLSTVLLSALFAHTAVVKYHKWRGLGIAEDTGISKAQLLAPTPREFSTFQIAEINAALEHLHEASSIRRGGLALMDQPEVRTRQALLSLARGEPDVAEAYLRRSIDRSGPSNDACTDLGALLISTGRRDEAIRLYEAWLSEDPDLWLVRDQLANQRRASGEVDRSIEEARALLLDIGDDTRRHEVRQRTHLQLARMLAYREDFDEAVHHYEVHLDDTPEATDVRAEYCMLLSGLGRHADAIASCEEAIQLLKRSEQVRQTHLTLARLHAGASNRVAAREAYDTVLKMRPWDTTVRREYCQMLLSRPGGTEDALAVAEAGIAETPKRYRYRSARQDAHRLYAETLSAMGRTDDAVAAWLAYDAQPPQSLHSLTITAQSLAQLGRADDALGHTERYLEADGRTRADRIGALVLRARLQLVRGEADSALAELDGLLAEEPHFWDAIELRARILMSQGRGSDAIAFASAHRDAFPDQPWYQPASARTSLLIADINASLRMSEPAIAAVEAAVDRQPHVASYRLLAADVHRNLPGGDSVAAERHLEIACRLDSLNPESWFQLGYACLLNDNSAGAEEAFRTTMRLAPRQPGLLDRIDQVYAQVGSRRIWSEESGSSSARPSP